MILRPSDVVSKLAQHNTIENFQQEAKIFMKLNQKDEMKYKLVHNL